MSKKSIFLVDIRKRKQNIFPSIFISVRAGCASPNALFTNFQMSKIGKMTFLSYDTSTALLGQSNERVLIIFIYTYDQGAFSILHKEPFEKLKNE